MKLTTNRARCLEVGEHLIVLASETSTGRGQGEITRTFTHLKPNKYIIKMYLLVDPKNTTTERCWKITRIA